MTIWILTGNEENWETAFNSGNIWGVREGNLVKRWEKLQKGDLVLFYVKSPIKGIIGFGKIESKFKQDKPLWPDEVRAKQVIYPYRFDFQILGLLSPEKWKEEFLSLSDLSISIQAGVNPIAKKEVVEEIINRVNDKFNVSINAPEIKEPLKEKEVGKSLHNQIRDKLVEIGQMERFISEKEYPIDGERLDATWRRVARGVPTKVFEVQIGGSPHQALSKLKHAFDLWNSEPFIIVDQENLRKVEELLSGTFHELHPYIRIILADKVQDLYDSLTKETSLKKAFGID
jgi:predicted RNA-binding protein